MELFTNQILAGISTGAIYACLALALVMIYQAIDHLNFAQGEMAMFSTFISWQLMQWGLPYWIAFIATLALSFIAGLAIERVRFHAPGRYERRHLAAAARALFLLPLHADGTCNARRRLGARIRAPGRHQYQ